MARNDNRRKPSSCLPTVRTPSISLFLLAVLALCAGVNAHAGKKTVCTITVNSSDEAQAFQSRLPKGEYEFVELIEKGRPDWLSAPEVHETARSVRSYKYCVVR